MTDLSTSCCGLTFRNPFVLPSGIITDIPAHKRAVDAGVGGVTLKSITWSLREGNPIPRVCKYAHGMLNSVGLRNPGIEKGSEEVSTFLKAYREKTVVIVSIFSTDVREFVRLAARIALLKPPIIELNLSCPNTIDELGVPLGMRTDAARRVVAAVKNVTGAIPLWAKLSADVSDIGAVGRACEEAGADAIVAINTVGPGMVLDIEKKKPVLGGKTGGLSGPGIFPIALRCVYELYESVTIPIVGMGGVSSWQDAVAMVLAGATLVGVGTVTYTKGMGVYEELRQGLSAYLSEHTISSLADLIGAAH